MNDEHDHLFVAYAAERTVANRNRIVVAHLDLVEKLLNVCYRRLHGADLDACRSAGYLGLVRSVERYDPARGVPFDGFASRRVHGAMIDSCRRVDVLSRTNRLRVKQWDEAVVQFTQAHGFPPTHAEVEAALGILPGAWQIDVNAGRVTATLAHKLIWKDDEDQCCTMPYTGPGPYEIAESRDAFEHLLATDTLEPEEQAVLRMRYQGSRTHEQIADDFDCSGSKISYMCKDARCKIAARLVA